tara:strand:- start:1818 stop:2129 length:312 start_codon:yes stop_codon:yes gene_type:complete
MGKERYRQQAEAEISDLKEKCEKYKKELERTKDRLRTSIMRESDTNSKYEKLLKEHKKCQDFMKKHGDLGEVSNPLYRGTSLRASKKKKKRKSSKRRKRSKKR